MNNKENLIFNEVVSTSKSKAIAKNLTKNVLFTIILDHKYDKCFFLEKKIISLLPVELVFDTYTISKYSKEEEVIFPVGLTGLECNIENVNYEN